MIFQFKIQKINNSIIHFKLSEIKKNKKINLVNHRIAIEEGKKKD